MKKLLVTVLLCFVLSPLQASIVLDQFQEGTIYGFAYDNEDPQNTSAAIRYQTFIPTASTLEQLDLYLEVWQRNDGQGGLEKPYGDTIRADITIEDSSGTSIWNHDYTYDGSAGFKSEWFSFSVPSVALTPGQTYKIQVLGHGIWRGNNQSDYPGVTDIVADWPDYDYAFRTYGAVPEPATLMLIGLGGLALRKRK